MRAILAATALCMTFGGPAAAAPVHDIFSSYLAFGDSLTDDGKFGEGALAPPSDGGRFSNGQTYAELIAKDFNDALKFSANFALGGATAELDNETDYPDPAAAAPFSTFAGQIGSLTALLASPLAAAVGENPLVSVLFGANDLLQDLGETASVGADAADAVKAGIEAIAALDPKFDSFLVVSLPSLSETPRFRGSPFAGLAEATTNDFNAQLEANVTELRDSGLNIVEIDLGDTLTKITDMPDAFGISEIFEACTPSFSEFTPLDNCAFDPATGAIDLAAADAFLFSDSIHPNRLAHEVFADDIRDAFDPSVVPLPAGLPLLMAGLGVFGLLRHRQRS